MDTCFFKCESRSLLESLTTVALFQPVASVVWRSGGHLMYDRTLLPRSASCTSEIKLLPISLLEK